MMFNWLVDLVRNFSQIARSGLWLIAWLKDCVSDFFLTFCRSCVLDVALFVHWVSVCPPHNFSKWTLFGLKISLSSHSNLTHELISEARKKHRNKFSCRKKLKYFQAEKQDSKERRLERRYGIRLLQITDIVYTHSSKNKHIKNWKTLGENLNKQT